MKRCCGFGKNSDVICMALQATVVGELVCGRSPGGAPRLALLLRLVALMRRHVGDIVPKLAQKRNMGEEGGRPRGVCLRRPP